MTTEALSRQEADNLVLEHKGWAESIARSVARAWNLDWQMDGLDGAAMEALIFCARRFDPGRGVPFRGYARKRIHEASTEAARKSKGWRRTLNSASKTDQAAREISAELFHIFPELHAGELPVEEGADSGDVRASIRQLIMGATIVAAKQGIGTSLPDEVVDYKRLIEVMATLETIHQIMMWKIYWEGESMRTVASDWDTDELNVIREHKVLLGFLMKCMSTSKELQRPKIRPGLKHVALKLKKTVPKGQFSLVVGQC
jgi:DNA-directed RNA polymerase specialized sigma subunit